VSEGIYNSVTLLYHTFVSLYQIFHLMFVHMFMYSVFYVTYWDADADTATESNESNISVFLDELMLWFFGAI